MYVYIFCYLFFFILNLIYFEKESAVYPGDTREGHRAEDRAEIPEESFSHPRDTAQKAECVVKTSGLGFLICKMG